MRRAEFLPAYVTIMVRAQDLDAAAAAARELDALARRQASDLLTGRLPPGLGVNPAPGRRRRRCLELREAFRRWEGACRAGVRGGLHAQADRAGVRDVG